MNSTEEWLRYIESQVIMKHYGINGYGTGSVNNSGSNGDNIAASYKGNT